MIEQLTQVRIRKIAAAAWTAKRAKDRIEQWIMQCGVPENTISGFHIGQITTQIYERAMYQE